MPVQAEPFGRCEEQLARAPNRWEPARCFYEVARSEGLWDDAAERLDTLAARRPDLLWLRLARAYVEEERDARRASAIYREAISAFSLAGHVEGEVRARCALATWLTAQENHAGAGRELALAVAAAERAGAQDALAEALVFQARHLHDRGTSLQESLRLARRAEGLLFPRGDPVRQMLCLDLLARLERDLGLPAQAAIRFRRLEKLARANGRRSLEAKAQLGLGVLLVDELDRAPRFSGHRERALVQLRQALETADSVGDPEILAGILASLSHLLESRERMEALDRCIALAQGRYEALAASCLLSRSRIEADEGDATAADRFLDEARAAAERSGDLDTIARFWFDRMNIRWRFGPPDQAVSDSIEAIRAVEALRDLQLEQAGSAGLFSRWLAPYYVASGHSLEAFQGSGDPADLDRAFEITESMRARVLRDLLASPRSPEARLSRRALETSLRAEEALLSFQMAPKQDLFGFAGGSWLLVSTRNGTKVYPLPETVERAHLETAVPALLGLIERRDGSEAELASALGSQLLGQALSDLGPGVTQLIIVPDGALHLLPFANLRVHQGEAPLSTRYEISMASSTTLWARWRRQPRRDVRAALVLADPELPRTVAVSSIRRGDEGGRLSGARREGRRILRDLGSQSILRVGSAAGEGSLKQQDLSRFGVLHLATHAVADEENPASSAVLLAADMSGQDGRLEVDEISKLDLRGNLVALSSCRSASGALVGGEGVMSLSRAFFAAGAAVVLGSLWPVRDDDAEAFFEVFYNRLAAGDTAAAAFSAAQRERIRDGAPAEAWAGFVLSGDGNWRLPPESQRPGEVSPTVLILAIVLAISTALLWRQRA